MPNHVSNYLRVEGSQESVNEFFNFLKGDNSLIDFNKIIPMPSDLDIESSSDGNLGVQYNLYLADSLKYPNYKEVYEWVNGFPTERKEAIIDMGFKYLSNKIKYGHHTWYEWRIANWGTRWNAYDIEKIDDYTISFNTAWNGVPELIGRLSRKFPELYIEYEFADEDAGYNAGSGYSEDGEWYFSYEVGDSDGAWEIYFRTHPGYEDYYEKVDGEWRWKEDE